MLFKRKKVRQLTQVASTREPDAECILDVKDLSVEFHTDDALVYAVNQIDLKLRRQKTLGLVGETGAGKTTTVLSLMRLIESPPGVVKSDGIFLNGRDVAAMSDAELETIRGKEISMIFQDPMTALNPVMTVGEQIAESLLLHEPLSKEEAREKAGQMLETVGISKERANEYPHQFSGGMKQRVVIAIALACHPEVLIADEPTTALDVTIQAQVLAMMNELKKTYNTAMIMITHDLGIIAETCDDVAVMYAGRIVEQGTLEEVFNHTKHPYTEGLFNSLPNMRAKRQPLKPIKGLTPDPTKCYPGCVFAERCPYATERCYDGYPEKLWDSETHFFACKRYDEPGFHIARRKTDA